MATPYSRPRFALAVLIALVGCASRPTQAPVPTVELRREGADCLVVLLPGRWDRPEDFRRSRFAETLQDAGVEADVTAVDAHIGYYREETIRERLRDDVLEPAVQRGYERIWLVGISLGGLGGLGMAMAMPEVVDGVVALSPFLGEEALIEEIRRAGGAECWATRPAEEDPTVFARLWRWLADATVEPGGPELVLTYGTGDDLAPANELLAALLPGERVLTTEGGHDWRTWAELWRDVVASGRVCGPDA